MTIINRYRSASFGGLVVILFVAFVFAALALADEKEETPEPDVRFEEWLLLGPLATPVPAFSADGDSTTKPADLLGYRHVSLGGALPVKGAAISLVGGSDVTWTVTAVAEPGITLSSDESSAQVAYLAAYLDVDRWTKVEVSAKGSDAFEVTIDGESVVKQKETADFDDAKAKTGTAKLERGKHLVVVKTVRIPDDESAAWQMDVGVSAKNTDDEPVLSLNPSRIMTIGDVLDAPSIGGVDVSPDGEYVTFTISRRTPPEGTRDTRREIRRISNGSLEKTIRDMSDTSDWQWAPTGHRLSYIMTSDDKGTIRVLDLETGAVETVVEGIEHLSGYDWSPNGTFIAYSVDVEAEKSETGVQRLRGLSDRRAGERDRSFLHLTSVPAGTMRRVTAGEHSTWLYDIHPDGKSLLIGRSYEELSRRPYSRSELVHLDLATQEAEILAEAHWIGTAQYSPDGKTILITASPTTFGDVGYDLASGVIPNDYDTQAYLFDPATKDVTSITKNFNPTVRSVYWPEPGNSVVVVAQESESVRLYTYDVKRKKFTTIDVDADVIHRSDVARGKPVVALVASSADHPNRLYSVDLRRGKVTTLLDPGKERFENVRIGKVESWDFTTESGTAIVGRIHYPPDFDDSREWPCIVYYYGGTSPVSRSFGGRYPKNLWAAMGYVVYVLQPSGATGYGQEFSALHVNDWGKIVADEIVDGTKKFLEAHPFVDEDRVGCIGASFGGFMTQLLVTKTDMFAAAVSHAGISSISSYWGEGYWGFGYNSVSAANSFPWNRRDIYVDQSPLFSADKIHTPLLLLHGTDDTNVPPGESEQMYAALKLLEREVEYLRIEGQNHWIVDYKKRIVWSNAIVSWFDRYLKDQPDWWNDMYPPLDDDGKDTTAGAR
ncbi:MAG: S9 family peptidase [bacterium]|nr:S9 family peptidase [bacterium]